LWTVWVLLGLQVLALLIASIGMVKTPRTVAAR